LNLLQYVLPAFYVPETQLVSQSAVFGRPSVSDGTSFNLSCPAGAKIVGFTGRAGAIVDALQAVCSDGSTLGPVGGNGGDVKSTATCQGGFSSVEASYDSWSYNAISGIVVDCAGSQSSLQGYNPGTSNTFVCPAGTMHPTLHLSTRFVESKAVNVK
jgi:hypothetical protein